MADFGSKTRQADFALNESRDCWFPLASPSGELAA